jgi:hypothetical protein
MIAWWRQHWFAEVPPHVFAAFRIALGVAGCLTMLGLVDVPLLVSTTGINAAPTPGSIRAAIDGAGLGTPTGWVIWTVNMGAFVGLVLGWQTGIVSIAAFVASGVLILWNTLPLSAAQHLLHNLTLYAVLSDCGRVWSIDARRAAARSEPVAPTPQPVWPLRLLQYQICVMYASAAMYKLLDPSWRDGTVLHYILNYNAFQRIPGQVPPMLDPLLAVMTYMTLAWEALFALAMLWRPTRRLFVIAGVFLHLGMGTLLDLGPFTPTVLAAYPAFVDAEDARGLAQSWAKLRGRLRRPSIPVQSIPLDSPKGIDLSE